MPKLEPSPDAILFIRSYLDEAIATIGRLNVTAIDQFIRLLRSIRDEGGRVFCLGLGGSAAQASHLVNDLRILAAIEAYTPLDNVAELTARINDSGWDTVFRDYLHASRLSSRDGVLVMSVGGGDAGKNISPNLVVALQYVRHIGARVLGIVGRDGGFTLKVADACILVPTVEPTRVTPHTEEMHSLLCHLIVTHPDLQAQAAKWETIGNTTLDAT